MNLDKLVNSGFWLILILICLAYYVGFSANAEKLFSGVNRTIRALQGRNQDTGAFENYPK